MNKDVDFIARGLILDNAIDDMIKELSVSPFNVIHSNEIYKDYKHYKPCILSSETLYRFFMIKVMTKETIVRNYNEFKGQEDYGIYKFIDYMIVDFTRGNLMEEIPVEENKFISKYLSERLSTVNDTIQ